METFKRHLTVKKLSDLLKELSDLQYEIEELDLEMALTTLNKPDLWHMLEERKQVVQERISHVKGHISVQVDVVKEACHM